MLQPLEVNDQGVQVSLLQKDSADALEGLSGCWARIKGISVGLQSLVLLIKSFEEVSSQDAVDHANRDVLASLGYAPVGLGQALAVARLAL
jgi:hypothetical protein